MASVNLPVTELSDTNLAAELFLGQCRSGKNLDEMTPPGKQRIIDALIDRTRPYPEKYEEHNRRRTAKIIPGGENDPYKGRDRVLGNAFIEGGFGFGGSPIDKGACTYARSRFKTNVESFTKA